MYMTPIVGSRGWTLPPFFVLALKVVALELKEVGIGVGGGGVIVP
jgi:hypothetical protein